MADSPPAHVALSEMASSTSTSPVNMLANLSLADSESVDTPTNIARTDKAPSSDPHTAAKVFAVTELLEAILLELPEAELLLAQRVNTTFKATISGSTAIKRKLFFEAEDGVIQADSEFKLNPLLGKICSATCAENYFCLDHSLGHPDAALTSKAGRACIRMPLLKPKLIETQEYKQASWRKMWATQPPLPVHPVLVWATNYEAKVVPATRLETIVEARKDPVKRKEAMDEWHADVYADSDIDSD